MAYHSDPRYVALYGPEDAEPDHVRRLLQTFGQWRSDYPRRNYQLGVFERGETGALAGCCGLRTWNCADGSA